MYPIATSLGRSMSRATCSHSAQAQLELRELEIDYPGSCLERASTRVLLLYDASSQRTWWSRDEHVLTAALYETDDAIVTVSGTVPRLEVRESAERHVSLNEAETHITEEIWRASYKSYRVIDLSHALPPEFDRPSAVTSARSVLLPVSRTMGYWQITVQGANGQTALVVLDEEFTVISASLACSLSGS